MLVTSKIPLLQKRLRSRKGWFILQRVFFFRKKMEWKAKRLSLGASDCVRGSAKSCIFLFLLFSAFGEDPPFEKSTFYEFWYTLSVCISLQTEASTVLHRWENHNKVLLWDSRVPLDHFQHVPNSIWAWFRDRRPLSGSEKACCSIPPFPNFVSLFSAHYFFAMPTPPRFRTC